VRVVALQAAGSVEDGLTMASDEVATFSRGRKELVHRAGVGSLWRKSNGFPCLAEVHATGRGFGHWVGPPRVHGAHYGVVHA
jgi:hypothetical protein